MRRVPRPKRESELAEIEAGMAFARAWRARNKPWYDAMFGPEHPSHGVRSQDYRGLRLVRRGEA